MSKINDSRLYSIGDAVFVDAYCSHHPNAGLVTGHITGTDEEPGPTLAAEHPGERFYVVVNDHGCHAGKGLVYADSELHEVFNRTNHSPTWWWLSFVDRTHSEGVSVALQLDVAIVHTSGDVTDAVEEAWQRNCNPGGEVMAQPLPHTSIPERFTNRLLTDADQIEALRQWMETAE